ncbi:AAA family ATPase [Halobaculum sp. WSA2]|uniref:ORC1-type DNA replication protein n=1 Tax=Halobaculum saliterrae TaxID=2073113 RepID=A0A6B0SMB7_9EURY|nr:AAA family ATPase [Halobaculum saliterrae]MXR40058.1 AAA family ATPase [Halobaculum saliterrae]
MTRELISDLEPLQPESVPADFVDRENTKTALSNLIGPDSSRNIHLQGPKGTGKTHLTLLQLNQLDQANTCYIDCKNSDTQYKTLRQILQSLTKEPVNTGYHTSDLQRKIEERTGAVHTVIVLDEIEFLLENDGDSLLYFLSRMKNQSKVNVITISNQNLNLQKQVEERTFSSLQPYPIQLEPYTGEEVYDILLERAQKSLKPQTVQKSSLTYIASTTTNPRLGIQWLKTAAQQADKIITETHVQQVQEKAVNEYINQILSSFTEHHRLLFQAIQELAEDTDTKIRTGAVYKRYQELCQSQEQESLSNRRISDHLKQLEHLNLIKAEYHYGGSKGKTREIRLKQPTP